MDERVGVGAGCSDPGNCRPMRILQLQVPRVAGTGLPPTHSLDYMFLCEVDGSSAWISLMILEMKNFDLNLICCHLRLNNKANLQVLGITFDIIGLYGV